MAADVLLQALADDEPALLEHAREVAELAASTAFALGLDRRAREIVARAAELHDIGKMAVPREILAKPGPLAAAELAVMRRHTLAVCDAFTAMCEERPYGHVLSEDEAVAELRRCAGRQFDPRVVWAFCRARGVTAVAV